MKTEIIVTEKTRNTILISGSALIFIVVVLALVYAGIHGGLSNLGA